MAQVTGPTPAKRIHDRANQIISVAKAEIFYIRHTDSDGTESITRVEVFGEADYGKSGKPEDRLLGIWSTANMKQLQDNLRPVTKDQALKIIAAMEEKGYVRDGKIATTTAPAELPDVSGAFEDLDAKEEKNE